MSEQINLNAITQVTEQDMGKAWEVFDQMRNAVLEGSKLSAQFQELQAKVQRLSDQLEQQIQSNKRLDDMYVSISRQRDDAMQEASRLKSRLSDAENELSQTKSALDRQVQANVEIANEEQRIMKERDEALLSAMEWEEKAESFRKRLDAVTAALGLPSPVQSQPTNDQSQEASSLSLSASQEVISGPLASGGDGTSPGGILGETEEQRVERVKREQPRDPVTQQWRSPQAPIGDEEIPF